MIRWLLLSWFLLSMVTLLNGIFIACNLSLLSFFIHSNKMINLLSLAGCDTILLINRQLLTATNSFRFVGLQSLHYGHSRQMAVVITGLNSNVCRCAVNGTLVLNTTAFWDYWLYNGIKLQLHWLTRQSASLFDAVRCCWHPHNFAVSSVC